MAGKSGSRPTGSSETYHAWLACFGEVLRDTAKGARLRARGEDQRTHREVFIATQAQNARQWNDRSAYVEKPLAKVLASAPHAYRVTMEQPRRSERGEEVSVLRLAFGLSASHFPPSRRRFTAYQVEPWKVGWVNEGSDRLFDQTLRDMDASRPRRGWESRLAQMFEHIKSIGDKSPRAVQDELDLVRFEQQLSVEADQLRRLYFLQSGNEARLHGHALHDLRGDAAVEAEYRQRLRNIHRRGELEIAFELVSIGEVVCFARRRGRRGAPASKLPFAEIVDA
jgi:hypothetical protein